MKLLLILIGCALSLQTSKYWTVSGFSAGGFMATQMAIAFSG